MNVQQGNARRGKLATVMEEEIEVVKIKNFAMKRLGVTQASLALNCLQNNSLVLK